MRQLYLGIVALVGACSFHPGTQSDAGAGAIIEGSGGAPFGGGIASGVVAARGVLEPDVFVPDGLHVVGYDSNTGITGSSDPGELSALGSATGESYGFAPDGSWQGSGTGDTYPFGLFIDQNTNWCIGLDGEILLDAGTTVIQVVADDIAIFDITAGSGVTSIVAPSAGQSGSNAVTVAATGWFPITGVMCNNGGGATLAVNTLDGSGSATEISASRFRAETTAVTGADMGVFFQSELEQGPQPGFDPGPLAHDPLTPLDYPTSFPYSIRYQGQLLVDTTGSHSFGVSIGSGSGSADHDRLFIDAQLVDSAWLTQASGSAAIELAAGWHAFVLDFGHDTGSAQLALSMDDAVIAADHLRPTQPEGHALAVNTGLLDGGAVCTWTGSATATTCPVQLFDLSPGAVTDYADLEYVVTGGSGSDVALALVADGVAAALPLPAIPNEQEFGASHGYDYLAQVSGGSGLGSSATIALSVVDPNPADTGMLFGLFVLSIRGGDGAPFAPEFDYTSQPYPVPPGSQVVAAHVDGDLAAAGVAVTVAVATAADPSALASAAFQTVGSAPIVTDAYLAFRVTVTDDGWTFPFVSRVEIDYAGSAASP